MAKVRIGFSTAFELENELVGIGTDNPTNTLQALGNIRSSNAKAVGVSTFTTFDGFTDTKLSLEGSAGAKQGTTSGEIIIEGEVTVSSGTTFTSGPKNLTVTNKFTLPKKTTYAPTVGSTRFNENLGALEFYTGTEWRAVNSYVDMGNRGRGLIIGGVDGAGNTISNIQSFQIATLGNTVQFGNLQSTKSGATANASDGVRGITFGGATPTDSNEIDYYTYASGGTAADFGNTTDARYSMGGVSSSTRGLAAGGWTPNNSNAIDYVEIQTLGDALDFGDLSEGGNHGNPGMQSPTRGIFCGGYGSFTPDTNSPYAYNRMQMVTIASKGNTTDFGNLIVGGARGGAGGNSVRGVYAGGYFNGINSRIEFVTLASEGNASYFGELTVARRNTAEVADSSTRAVFCGGIAADGTAPAATNYMDYITIASAGNAVDFGDVTGKIKGQGAFSDSHGGLGGF